MLLNNNKILHNKHGIGIFTNTYRASKIKGGGEGKSREEEGRGRAEGRGREEYLDA